MSSLYWHQDNEDYRSSDAGGKRAGFSGARREPQIWGRSKSLCAVTQTYRSLSRELERLFQKSFSVAKRVRTETDIGANAVSVAFAACTPRRVRFRILIQTGIFCWVGAGETIRLVARHLKRARRKT